MRWANKLGVRKCRDENASKSQDPTAKATNLVAGLEYRVNDHVTLIPNIVWTHYGINESGVKPDDDLHLRLTFYVNFE